VLGFALMAGVGCATDATEVGVGEEVGQTIEGSGLVSRGAHLYMKYCQPCHGAEGAGDGPAVNTLDTPPRDFTAGEYKFRSTNLAMLPTAGDLYRTIAQGVPGTAMPGWDRRLADREMWAIVAFLETLTPGYDDEQRRPLPEGLIPIPEAAPMTAESVDTGRELFSQFGCTSCHGEDGRGRGPSAAELDDYKGRPLPPPDFATGVYKSGPHPRDLYRSIAAGLAGTSMPGYAQVFEPAQIWQLVHYIRSLREERGFIDYLLATEPGRL
jgi:cytochrome c oxidase cbb3-type subunit 2